jgi:RNA polymerase sigma factor (sigma-70 family)
MKFFQRNSKEGKLTDQELLVLIRKGGPDEKRALDDLYGHTRPRIVDWVRKNGGNKDDGEDAFQNAMLVFYQYLQGDKFGGEQLVRAFLWQTARNVWVLKCRGSKKESPLPDHLDPPDNSAEAMLRDLINDEQNRDEILQMIGRACPSCRELLELQFFQGFANEALAEHFGHQENSVKVKRSNCLKTLREYLRAHPEAVELFTHSQTTHNFK